MISLKIDVKKLDKKRFYIGEKGTYADLILIETPNSEYGHSHMIAESVSREEREAGIKGNIVGNAKVIGRPGTAPEIPAKTHIADSDVPPDDIPF